MTGRTVGHLGRLSYRFQPDVDKMRGRIFRWLRNKGERLRVIFLLLLKVYSNVVLILFTLLKNLSIKTAGIAEV